MTGCVSIVLLADESSWRLGCATGFSNASFLVESRCKR